MHTEIEEKIIGKESIDHATGNKVKHIQVYFVSSRLGKIDHVTIHYLNTMKLEKYKEKYTRWMKTNTDED